MATFSKKNRNLTYYQFEWHEDVDNFAKMMFNKLNIVNNDEYESSVNAEFIKRSMSTLTNRKLLSFDEELTLVFLEHLRLLRGLKVCDTKRSINNTCLEVGTLFSKRSNSSKRSKVFGETNLHRYPNKFSPHRSADRSSTSCESQSSE